MKKITTFAERLKSQMEEVNMSTSETYGHIVDGEDRRAAEVIDLTFGQNFGQNESTTDGL